MKRLTLALGLVALAAVLAACSGASAAPATSRHPSAAPAAPAGDAVTIVAKDIKFQQTDVAVTADKPLSVDLRQPGRRPAQHRDLGCVRAPRSSRARSCPGRRSRTRSRPWRPGTYAFICEVHPDMKGTITAK